MPKREKDWAAKRIDFIFAEIDRISPLLRPGADPALLEEMLFNSIQSAKGFGSLAIGKQGSLAVFELAQEALKRCGLSGRVHESEAANFLQKHLSSLSPLEGQAVNVEAADKLLRDAALAVAKKCKTRTHFFPVRITTDQSPERIDLGVVQLHSKGSLERRFADAEAMLAKSEKSEAEEDTQYRSRIIAYYQSFNWVAEVTVENCDITISRNLAKAAVRSAVDIPALRVRKRHINRLFQRDFQPLWLNLSQNTRVPQRPGPFQDEMGCQNGQDDPDLRR